MVRMAVFSAIFACCGLLSGCCSGPCGPCGGGCGYGRVGEGPAVRFHRWRKELVCGAGCCETYHGEWRSYPPDCEDPCCFDYSVNARCGGCGACDECCFSPLPPKRPWLLGFFQSIYGERFCDGCGEYGCAGCGYYGDGCATGDCGGCDGCGGNYFESGYDQGSVHGGCTSCGGGVAQAQPQSNIRQTRRASRPQREIMMARNQSTRSASADNGVTWGEVQTRPPAPPQTQYRASTRRR